MFGMAKQESVFYGLFNESIGKIREAAAFFDEIVNDYGDVKQKVAILKEMEIDCDGQTHKVLATLNAAFITPFDREDIYQITKEMDNIIDKIEEAGNRLSIFHVTEMKPEAIMMSGIILSCTKELESMINGLDTLGKSDFLHSKIVEINRLENGGDVVHRRALEQLFETEKDPVEIIKWKNIYEILEEAIDVCEGVANLVEGLISKHSS
jgi:hypothetical protein